MTDTSTKKGAPQKQQNTITLDYDLYAHYLEDEELSEEQKREFLEALWDIICEFVALGFNIHPLQQAQYACGKPRNSSMNKASNEQNLLDCRHPNLSNLFQLADAVEMEETHGDSKDAE